MRTPFIERARKFLVGVAGIVALVGGVLAKGDFSTVEGIIAGVAAALITAGIYRVPNDPDVWHDEVDDGEDLPE